MQTETPTDTDMAKRRQYKKRRTPEEMIADLQKQIERVKERAERTPVAKLEGADKNLVLAFRHLNYLWRDAETDEMADRADRARKALRPLFKERGIKEPKLRDAEE